MKPTRETLSLMALAAELRAGGNSWEAVASHVHRSPRTCRSWPQRYPQEWRQFFDEAEERLLADVGAEALFNLRVLARSGSERVKHDASKYLYSRRRDAKLRKVEAAAAPAHGDWAPYIAFLETQDDAQVRAFLLDHLVRRLTQTDPAVPAAGGAPSASVGQ